MCLMNLSCGCLPGMMRLSGRTARSDGGTSSWHRDIEVPLRSSSVSQNTVHHREQSLNELPIIVYFCVVCIVLE